MSYNLDKYSIAELRQMASKMELPSRRSKVEMIEDITKAFKEYEDYHKSKVEKYKRIRQLGHKGKEGTTYLVEDSKGRQFAMKTFRKGKSSANLLKECKLQKQASKFGISPRVYDYDTVSKYIVMDRMDCHLLEVMKKQKGILKRNQQKRIWEIYQKLDEAKVFHGDANLANYMVLENQIYIIDFGFSKPIDAKLVKRLNTDCPNQTMMLLGFILKLKEMGSPKTAYNYLIKHVPKEDIEKFKLND